MHPANLIFISISSLSYAQFNLSTHTVQETSGVVLKQLGFICRRFLANFSFLPTRERLGDYAVALGNSA